MTRTGLACLVGLGLFSFGGAGAAAADPVEQHCQAANQALTGACEVVRPERGEWILTTRVVLGEAGKHEVTQLEEQFCRAAWSAGQSARVTRWSALPNTTGNGARMAWDCGPPAVAAGPR